MAMGLRSLPLGIRLSDTFTSRSASSYGSGFNNTVFTEPRSVTELTGTFGVQREGDVVRSWHGPAGDKARCQLLGEHRGDPAPDVILGAKIWSGGTTGGLRVGK